MWDATPWNTNVPESTIDQWYIDNYETLCLADLKTIDQYSNIEELQNEWVILHFAEDDVWCIGSLCKSDIEKEMTDLLIDGISTDITIYHFGKDVNWKVSIED